MELQPKIMVDQRRSRVLGIVQRRGFASLPDLAVELGVSESTVRRDLAHLEREGAAKRTHGGAFFTGAAGASLTTHQVSRQEQKQAIARVAAGLIGDRETVLLDGGSTTYELGQQLLGRTLQVVTNSLPMASLLAGASGIDLVVLGGYVHGPSGALHGEFADRMLEGVRVGKAVIGAGGINAQGLHNDNQLIVGTQRAMMRAAEEVIVVADSSKFGRASLASLCPLSQINRLVTDDELDDKWREVLADAGIEVHLASTPKP
ncbi:Glucitol operon repressor [Pirellulimonas nuda]|uniref:Glucitol operon repressor n=1 Tax=Pirellulimonas nuda TaxID=2528009 RepID=A0A518DGN4_9BACT|nr:DeoR/GlpR family DNA-binding transcription regulator [Pirellulimonas nuda]QDU90634.1 Glucitol operon repressor [Pirellulimonas nuda]